MLRVSVNCGWNATSVTACGGAFTADQGVLMSPNYPNPYPHNGVCIWTITVHQRARISFTVTDMDLERHGNCAWDYVEVMTVTCCGHHINLREWVKNAPKVVCLCAPKLPQGL